jgi:hypothetical protein
LAKKKAKKDERRLRPELQKMADSHQGKREFMKSKGIEFTLDDEIRRTRTLRDAMIKRALQDFRHDLEAIDELYSVMAIMLCREHPDEIVKEAEEEEKQ